LEDNDIFANAMMGVGITTGGNPGIRKNRISGNELAIFINAGGRGIFEGNDLRGNKRGAWDISPDCLDKIGFSLPTPESNADVQPLSWSYAQSFWRVRQYPTPPYSIPPVFAAYALRPRPL
jgi:parallel beta-helix repeat protein